MSEFSFAQEDVKIRGTMAQATLVLPRETTLLGVDHRSVLVEVTPSVGLLIKAGLMQYAEWRREHAGEESHS